MNRLEMERRLGFSCGLENKGVKMARGPWLFGSGKAKTKDPGGAAISFSKR